MSTISNIKKPTGAPAARPTNKGYSEAGASHTKKALKGFTAQSGSPREDIDYNNATLRQRGRLLAMSTPVAASAIRTNRTNVIGMGLKLKARVNAAILGMTPEAAEEWQRIAEAEFKLWAENRRACDATGVNNFYEMQQLALTSWLTSGDCFVLFKERAPEFLTPYSLRLHIIEADRISTPGDPGFQAPHYTSATTADGHAVYDGVEIDSEGMVIAYHIRNTYPMDAMAGQPTSWVRVEAVGKETGLPNILQLMESERPDQYRGVSYLAPVIEPLLQLRRYTESELTAAVVESFFTAFVKTEAGTDENPFNEVGDGTGNPTDEVSKDPNEYEMGPGQVNIMEPGEDVTFADPKRPASGFQSFMDSICEQIGAALEIPKDLLLKAFNSSYSASRAALLEAWKAFSMRRDWFVRDFCRPIYEAWLTEAVARGRIIAPGYFTNPLLRSAYLGSDWIGPSQGQLDPEKEINAEILAIAHGFSTHAQSTIKLNGGEWGANVEQLSREAAQLETAGLVQGADEDPAEQLAASIKALILQTIKEEMRSDEKHQAAPD